MMNWPVALFLGIIEGITEFLPISSTAHLLIAERYLTRQSDLFNIVIQSGAVLAVLPLFRNRLSQFVFDFSNPETKSYLGKIVLAFVITGFGGIILQYLGFGLPENLVPVAIALLVGGIGFLVVEGRLKKRSLISSVTWKMAILVGFGQLLAAVFPGTSRSGVTILIMLMCGATRLSAVEFTFLVGIPTMLAAGGLEIFQLIVEPTDAGIQENWSFLGVSFLTSMVVSFVTVKWLLTYVQAHTFNAFGWYRIVLAVVLFVIL